MPPMPLAGFQGPIYMGKEGEGIGDGREEEEREWNGKKGKEE